MIKSWLIIPLISVVIIFSINRLNTSEGYRWFNRLIRPRWLKIESLIPLIWTVILISGNWSAYVVWETEPNTLKTWWLMGLYLVVEILIMLYTPVMFFFRSLVVGTIIGGVGCIFGWVLGYLIWPISPLAFGLLLPYLIWSPIGTYVTWEMDKIN
jgi:tryptophan-rich sensory protein